MQVFSAAVSSSHKSRGNCKPDPHLSVSVWFIIFLQFVFFYFLWYVSVVHTQSLFVMS